MPKELGAVTSSRVRGWDREPCASASRTAASTARTSASRSRTSRRKTVTIAPAALALGPIERGVVTLTLSSNGDSRERRGARAPRVGPRLPRPLHRWTVKSAAGRRFLPRARRRGLPRLPPPLVRPLLLPPALSQQRLNGGGATGRRPLAPRVRREPRLLTRRWDTQTEYVRALASVARDLLPGAGDRAVRRRRPRHPRPRARSCHRLSPQRWCSRRRPATSRSARSWSRTLSHGRSRPSSSPRRSRGRTATQW